MALSLAIENLDAGYGAVKALRGVTLHVESGETVALLGTNGNGKSTLMKCIMGIVPASAGRITAPRLTAISRWCSRLSRC